MTNDKKEFFVLVDYGTGSTGYVVRAYSRKQIDEIYDLPKSKWISVIEDGFEEHPIYQAQVNHSGSPLCYDVDAPEGSLLHYMERNGVIVPYTGIPE